MHRAAAVVAGRRRRYVLLNAPVAAVDRIAEVVPGLEAPTVVPLAEDGWVAVHSVVDADDVWNLLSRAGGGRRQGDLGPPDRAAHPVINPLTRVELATLTTEQRRCLTRRTSVPNQAVMAGAAAIVAAVAAGGDAALAEAGSKHGGGRPGRPLVSPDEQSRCLAALPVTVRQALERSIDALTAFHRVQVPADVSVETVPGVFGGAPLVAAAACSRLRPRRASRLPVNPADDGCARSDRRCR